MTFSICLFVPCPYVDEEDHEQTEKGSKTYTLSKGMHTFDYSFHIPSSCPASFTSDHGFIKYIIRAQVHFANKVESNLRYFTVTPVFDLNRVSNVEVRCYTGVER